MAEELQSLLEKIQRDGIEKAASERDEMLKNAMFAEKSIVYGNRYRSTYEDVDKSLTLSEQLFYKGEYKKSFELTINGNYLGLIDNLLNCPALINFAISPSLPS